MVSGSILFTKAEIEAILLDENAVLKCLEQAFVALSSSRTNPPQPIELGTAVSGADIHIKAAADPSETHFVVKIAGSFPEVGMPPRPDISLDLREIKT
jgi:ornithine cyclodeaminase/alanine dehydrogenase-like protein (mu-crystallin family)